MNHQVNKFSKASTQTEPKTRNGRKQPTRSSRRVLDRRAGTDRRPENRARPPPARTNDTIRSPTLRISVPSAAHIIEGWERTQRTRERGFEGAMAMARAVLVHCTERDKRPGAKHTGHGIDRQNRAGWSLGHLDCFLGVEIRGWEYIA